MNFRFHTKAIIYNQQWKILIQKRTDTGKWDLIWWRTELPERIEAAITREIQEETWIVDIQRLDIISLESDFSSEKDEYFVLIIFKGKTESLSVKISEEHKDHMRVTKEELLSIWMSDYLQKSLEKIIDLF